VYYQVRIPSNEKFCSDTVMFRVLVQLKRKEGKKRNEGKTRKEGKKRKEDKKRRQEKNKRI